MALHKKAIDAVWDEITDDDLGEVCTVRARYGEVVFRAIEAAEQGAADDFPKNESSWEELFDLATRLRKRVKELEAPSHKHPHSDVDYVCVVCGELVKRRD